MAARFCQPTDVLGARCFAKTSRYRGLLPIYLTLQHCFGDFKEIETFDFIRLGGVQGEPERDIIL